MTNGLLSFGMLIVILSGGIDLSIGPIVALTGIMAAGLQAYMWFPFAIIIALLVGITIGAANGFLVGVAGEKAALVNIMQADSNYAATGLNNSDQIGRAAFHRMMAILADAKAPQKTVLPSPLITKDNVCRHYNPDSVF